MCRRYAELTTATLLATLLLAGCGATPSATDSPMPSVPSDASAPPAATTAPLPDRDASKSETFAAAGTGKPSLAAGTEGVVPAAAARQFDDAVAMVASGNAPGAESAFRSLAAAYPTFAAPLVNLAILQAKAGQLEAAEQTLRDATARNAGSAPAFNQLGIVYRRLGRFQEADAAYQRALELDANYATAWLNLGVLCDLYLQQPQRALEAYERYLALAPAPDARVNGWISELKARLGSGRSARAQ